MMHRSWSVSLRMVLAALLPATLVMGTCGCGTQESARDATGNVSSSPASGDQARIASSMSAYIEFLLDNDKTVSIPMSERQRAILERALNNGGTLSKADHEEAWNNYRQCTVDKGYTPVVTTVYAQGVRGSAPMVDVGNRGEEVLQKVYQDDAECNGMEYGNVGTAYRLQVGNPSLVQDRSEGVAECLRRNGLVEKIYTGATFDREQEEWQDRYGKLVDELGVQEAQRKADEAYSFDRDDPQVQLCHVTNGIDIRQEHPDDSEVWYPFGK